MYRYISHGDAELPSGILHRDPATIREELSAIREALFEAEKRMKEAEARREELLPLLAAEDECPPEAIEQLDEALADCEEIKETMEGLWERVDMLAEELSETLWWLRGTCA